MSKSTTPTRTPNGKRHEVTVEFVPGDQVANLRAVCVCGGLNAPARFSRAKAEEDGFDHLDQYAKKGMPPRAKGGR